MKAPGLFLDAVLQSAPPAFAVGVPAFLSVRPGTATTAELCCWKDLGATERSRVVRLDAAGFSRLEEKGGLVSSVESHLGSALRGFFFNGGQTCCLVAPRNDGHSGDVLEQLEWLDAETGFDLVCAPDVLRLGSLEAILRVQAEMLRFCHKRGDCFTILDTFRCPGTNLSAEMDAVGQHRAALQSKLSVEGIDAAFGAMYLPWFKVTEGTGTTYVPPSGHVAGVYARTDRTLGVFKAPANEVVEGIVDVEIRLTAKQQEALEPQSMNCIRVFSGRGVRIWGARTLAKEGVWTSVNQRRLVSTLHRWLAQTMGGVAFEPNEFALWIRIRREVNAFLSRLFDAGALRGNTPDEAFYVKCDAETNSPRERAAGRVVTEIGLALQKPSEFVVARIIYGADRTREATSAPVGT